MKRQKEVTKLYRMNQCFSYYFCFVIEGSVSGFKRPKNIRIQRIRIWIPIRIRMCIPIRIRIRIRIRNTDCRVTSFRRER
jgi:hypothetical protein